MNKPEISNNLAVGPAAPAVSGDTLRPIDAARAKAIRDYLVATGQRQDAPGAIRVSGNLLGIWPDAAAIPFLESYAAGAGLDLDAGIEAWAAGSTMLSSQERRETELSGRAEGFRFGAQALAIWDEDARGRGE
jgi:hypothetical protein